MAWQRGSEVVHGDLEDLATRLDGVFRRLAGQRLLITGGGGFLGYYLVQAPLHWNRQHRQLPPIRVVLLDNFQRGRPIWLTEWAGDPALTLIEHDISEPLPDLGGPFAALIHAASVASPSFYRQQPIATIDANISGLRQLLTLARQQQLQSAPPRCLFFSSSEVYGDPDPDQIPLTEPYHGAVSCTGPRACYDESKRFGETLCVNFARHYQLPIVSVRPFNNYGPGLRLGDRRVIPDFARDLLAGRDVVLYSDGSPTRTFCYVSDAIVGYYRALLDGVPGEAYNIGNEQPEISIRQLAEQLIEQAQQLFGYRGNLRFATSQDSAYLTDNPQRRAPSIAKARQAFGFEPAVTLSEGLHRSLLWYRDYAGSVAGGALPLVAQGRRALRCSGHPFRSRWLQRRRLQLQNP